MDIREIPSTQLRGSTIGFFAPMNGGKTEGMIQELKRTTFYNFHPVAYNHKRNTREINNIVIDGKEPYPATTVEGIPQLRDDLDQKITQLRKLYHQGEIEQIEVNIASGNHLPKGIQNLNEIAVGIDEINLFCLTEKETQDTLSFIDWCRENNLVRFVAGLLYDFRHRPFGHVTTLLPYIDIKEEKKPACMAIRSAGKKCDSTAKHTQRVWSKEFAQELGLDFLLELQADYNYVDKNKEQVLRQYIAAPFFDMTLRIEAERDKKIAYLPVCTDCAKLPYKEETFIVYNQIIRREKPVLQENQFTKLILEFLLEEQWITEEKNKLSAVAFYRNNLGSFSTRT